MTQTKTRTFLGVTFAPVLLGLVVAGGTACSSKSPSDEAAADSGAPVEDSSASADTAAADTAPAGPVYPKGPYGVTVGKIIDPSFNWVGYAPGATASSTISIADFYDPDGTKGINALVIDSSGQWCVACQYIAKLIPSWFSAKGDNWKALGVQMLTLVIQNNNYEPADLTTAQQWRALFDLNFIYVVADPNDTFPTNALPSELLVDPRTMKITRDLSDDSAMTADGADPEVATLAKANQK
jgi:hypothetical protein